MLPPKTTRQLPYGPHAIEVRLWQQFRAGSREAFEQLTQFFYRDLHFYGSRFTSDTDLLKDCLQDLFVDLWVYRRQIVDTDYVRPYLYKSLRRNIARELRRTAALLPNTELPFSETDSHDPTAEQQLIQTELATYQASRLNTLMDRLSDRQREAIHLKFYSELTNDQIADVLHVNKQSVANLIHRGLTRLREEWSSLLPAFASFFLFIHPS